MANLGQDASVNLMGRVGGHAIQVKGKKTVSFDVAVSSDYKDRNGKPVEQDTWIPVILDTNNVDAALAHIKKGVWIHVKGELLSTLEKVILPKDGREIEIARHFVASKFYAVLGKKPPTSEEGDRNND